MIITALIHTRHRHTRAELQRMIDGLNASRARADHRAHIARAQTIRVTIALLEATAAGYLEDAAWLDRPGVKQHGVLDANQRRAIADELRNIARDIQGRPE